MKEHKLTFYTFRKLDNGQVEIDAGFNQVDMVSPNEWCKIISAMSNSRDPQDAYDFHMVPKGGWKMPD
jgi:hypothetical protein